MINMPLKDLKLNKLVDEQTQYFLEEAPLEKKLNVLKRIQKRQKELIKEK